MLCYLGEKTLAFWSTNEPQALQKSWARDKAHCSKNDGVRASSVSLLHDAPFWMQVTTADQLVFFVLPWVNFCIAAS